MTNPLTIYNSSTGCVEGQEASLWQEVTRIFADFERTAFATELKAIFENLQDQELLETLQKTRWTGRPGYPLEVMWRSLIVAYVLNIPSLQELRRKLYENPFLSQLCGIDSEKGVPSRFAYYRFIGKLIVHRHLVEGCLTKCAQLLKENLPDYGTIVAVDSSVIHTHSNPNKEPVSDEEASWTAKEGKLRKQWHFGYKVQAVVDARYELPICIQVSTAKASDMKAMVPLLTSTKNKLHWFSPTEVLADAGYDTHENYRFIYEQCKATPVIKLKNPISHRLSNLVRFIGGVPHCLGRLPLIYRSKDEGKGLQYQCPDRARKAVCPLSDKCPLKVVWLKPEQIYRLSLIIPRDSEAWAELYAQRVSAERVFSRLKEHRRLDRHYFRGFEKVELHCLLSVLSLQSGAVSSVMMSCPEKMRICTRQVG